LATPQFALGDLHACTQAAGPVGAELMGALSLRIWASGCPPTSIGAREQCAERPRRLGGRSGRGCRHGNVLAQAKPRRNRLTHGSVSRACRMGGQSQGPSHIFRHPGRVGQCLPIEHPEKVLLGVEENVPQATPSDNDAGMSRAHRPKPSMWRDIDGPGSSNRRQ